ncbi:TrbG/VirB9 family P-type conjugative transfer protein [Candidatus Mesenet endosymbiont of Agriotes lineatus]|uniref:TrbG/VirB9 family P-type conjugative transfer protein n=1 Tax=Candidatus Mesenet endosymbiont of Agriotes lineatus TaxID=3077948 RepID=UPI0039778552
MITPLFIFSILFSDYGLAEQAVRSIATNDHIKVMSYNPQSIHEYIGFYGYQSSILFEEGESIGTISMGDSTGWQLNPESNRLFIKPIEDNADTNATIITNKRVYHFELHAEEAKGLDDPRLAYEVRFVYSSNEGNISLGDSNKDVIIPANQTVIPDLSDPEVVGQGLNFNYSVAHSRGSQAIVPLKVFDDGKFTYLQFSSTNTDLPSIFLVDYEGYESLINFRVVDDYVIIERVSAVFTLRHGAATACLFNEQMSHYFKNGSKKFRKRVY